MSSHRDWFQAYSPLNPLHKIWLRDNTFIQALSIGCIPIHMHANCKWNRAILQDVLYVLALHINLLSVSMLALCGTQVHFAPKTCEIQDKDNLLTCIGHVEDNLYILDACTYVCKPTCITQVNIPKSDEDFFAAGHVTALRFHVHTQAVTANTPLGHLNVNTAIKMARKGMVNGMTMAENAMHEALGTCELHIKGKHACQAIKKMTQMRANSILGHIYSNLCGLMQTSSRKGYYHFTTFIDDKS